MFGIRHAIARAKHQIENNVNVSTECALEIACIQCIQLISNIFRIYFSKFFSFFRRQIMDEVREGLKYLFQTKNPVTFCVTGSGNSGMETVLSNLIEPGDVVLIAIIGAFGLRAVDMVRRKGADVRVIEAKLGTALKYDQIRAHLETHKPKLLFTVHGDSSTGVLQSLDNLGDLCQR